MSFGEEAEEDEEESVVLSKQLGSKSKSAHDSLSDPELSSQTVIESEGPSSKEMKKDDNNDSENDGDSKAAEERASVDKEKE